jgi:IS4 transposase
MEKRGGDLSMVILDIQKNKVEIAKVVHGINNINVGPVCSFALPEDDRQNGKYIPQKIAELQKAVFQEECLTKKKLSFYCRTGLLDPENSRINKTKENLCALSILEARLFCSNDI